MFSLLFSVNAPTQAQSSLMLKALPGSLAHDASYLPRLPYWPDEWDWNGSGLNDDSNYRYGPALIRYADDNLHFWACSEGDGSVGIADYIRYKHSHNGGLNWSEDIEHVTETIALAPTQGSPDGWAVCDPNVIKIGSYYYMAYTATASSFGAGLNNEVFVARSTSADKNYQKWNGSGWGGSPVPIVRYTGIRNKWGLGEPNMVVKGNTLYLYFTEDEGDPKTRVATAPASNPNWPAYLTQRGYAIEDRDFGEDQTDVKYLPEVNLFIATATAKRFTSNSYVHVWQSSNGLRFQPVTNDVVRTNLKPKAHNLGMSGHFLGHAKMGTNEYIAYAYVTDEGRWNSWINPVRITGAGWVEPPPIEIPKTNVQSFLMLLLDD